MAGPYDKLPEPIDFDKLVTSVETEPVPDPGGGLDPERVHAPLGRRRMSRRR